MKTLYRRGTRVKIYYYIVTGTNIMDYNKTKVITETNTGK